MDEEYNLQPGEVVIMQGNKAVLHSGKDREALDEIVLTNKNLILVNEVSTSLFTTQRLLKRCPLDSIACPKAPRRLFSARKRMSTFCKSSLSRSRSRSPSPPTRSARPSAGQTPSNTLSLERSITSIPTNPRFPTTWQT